MEKYKQTQQLNGADGDEMKDSKGWGSLVIPGNVYFHSLVLLKSKIMWFLWNEHIN